MNNLLNDKISSLEIAELTGRNHGHLLRDIRNMEESWERVVQSKFGFGYYLDNTGIQRPMYQLTKDECSFVAAKFNDEVRAKLVLRWHDLELKRNKSLEANLQTT